MPNPTIDAVLFDADGVLQRPTIDWRSALGSFAGPAGPAGVAGVATPDEPTSADGRVDDFILDVMTSEGPSLVGAGDFADALAEVLARWGSTATVDDVLNLWHQFAVDPVAIKLVQDLRAAGIHCYLATNQQAYRRKIMREELNYNEWFDQSFYSSELGVAKPDPAYFRTILDTLGLPARSALFIDDNAANVASARTVGLHAEQYDLDTGVDTLRDLLRAYKLPVPD
jgi:HAD superfamily hydrolase (TIGR01509 family)